MKKKYLFIIAVCFLSYSISYAEPEPARPSNIPMEAFWDGAAFWKYYDDNKRIFYHWYSNGKLRSSGHYINDRAHGKVEYWSPDGTKIMYIIYDHGIEKKKFNYKIVFPGLQRPINLPRGAIWDFKNIGWSYYDVDNSMLNVWYINGGKKIKSKIDNLNSRKKDGKFIFWYKNGIKGLEGNYRNNVKNGKFIHRNKKGDITNIRYYKNGRKIWSNDYTIKPPKNLPKGVVWHVQMNGWKIVKNNVQYIYRDNGKLKHKTEMKGLDYHGKTISYFPTGEMMIEGQFNESSMEGEWKYYYRNGKVGKIDYYKNNKEIKTKYFKK